MRPIIAIALTLAALGAGCGSDDSHPEPAGSLEEVTIEADQPRDERIGADLRRYLVRNCPGPSDEAGIPEEQQGSDLAASYLDLFEGILAFCGGVASIEVEDGRIAVRSGLPADIEGDFASDAFCGLIQGSDVADFTAGHELQDLDGETIKVCTARSG